MTRGYCWIDFGKDVNFACNLWEIVSLGMLELKDENELSRLLVGSLFTVSDT